MTCSLSFSPILLDSLMVVDKLIMPSFLRHSSLEFSDAFSLLIFSLLLLQLYDLESSLSCFTTEYHWISTKHRHGLAIGFLTQHFKTKLLMLFLRLAYPCFLVLPFVQVGCVFIHLFLSLSFSSIWIVTILLDFLRFILNLCFSFYSNFFATWKESSF